MGFYLCLPPKQCASRFVIPTHKHEILDDVCALQDLCRSLFFVLFPCALTNTQFVGIQE